MGAAPASRLYFSGTALPLAFFTLFFILNGILGYFSIQNIQHNQRQVITSLQNLNLIHQIHIEILKAETGQRGYLLTDLESYATPFEEAMAVLDQRLANLADAPLDISQRDDVYRLQLLLDERVDEMRNTVDALRDRRERDAIQMLFSHRGRNIMNEISDVLARMNAQENRLLEDHVVRTRESRTTSLAIVLLANVVGLVMVFVTLSLVRKSMRKEEEFARTLQLANDSLEAKVEERTAALSHYSNELKRSNRELQDFAFVASHDLQEPLRKIRAFGDRLLQNFGGELGEQGRDYIDRMQKASIRMSTLIADLLSFSRITTKAEPFVCISLKEVVDEVLDDLEIACEEAGARIEVADLPQIEADRSQMKQLFQNLLGNAIKFRRPEHPPRIELSCRQVRSETGAELASDWVEILVTDNGIGFDEKFLTRIFTPFQRLHGKAEYTGTGIGLAVCRRIVERHGGSITARSRPGEGSTFIIRLPLKNVVFAPASWNT